MLFKNVLYTLNVCLQVRHVKKNESYWMPASPSVPAFLHEFSDGLRLLQIIAHGAPTESRRSVSADLHLRALNVFYEHYNN